MADDGIYARETRTVRQLARALGIDTEDERALFLLYQEEISTTEAAELLGRSRQALHLMLSGGYLPARAQELRLRAKRVQLWYVRPRDLLVWAVNRPERHRYVDRERARRYAEADGREFGAEATPAP